MDAPVSDAPRAADFAARVRACQARIEGVLERALALPDPGTQRLREAMRYSALGAGKRLRPTLVYLTGESLGAPLENLDAPAAAVELIHVYSLVHDDLPAMDDDDLRRGRPTCHRAFPVLETDAHPAAAHAARVTMIRILARAAGTTGMAGGQAIDLVSVGQI